MVESTDAEKKKKPVSIGSQTLNKSIVAGDEEPTFTRDDFLRPTPTSKAKLSIAMKRLQAREEASKSSQE